TYQYNIPADPASPPPTLLPIDPTILGLAGIGVSALALVFALVRRGNA
ncbi:unnamed protein product, partial [marine sediment metagenome]